MNLMLEYITIQPYNQQSSLGAFQRLPLTGNPKFIEPWLRSDHSNRGVIAHHY